MPIYDCTCTGCGEIHAEIFSYEEYEKIDTVECGGCGTPLTKDSRLIGSNINTVIRGVRKGNYNSGDYS